MPFPISELLDEFYTKFPISNGFPNKVFPEFFNTKPVNQITSSLDFPLVYQFFKGLFIDSKPDVKEKFIPETGIDQMAGSVFVSSDIEIDILPVISSFFGEIALMISRIHVTQVIAT